MFQKITIALMPVLTVAVIVLAAMSVGEHRRGNELEARLNDLSQFVSDVNASSNNGLDALTSEVTRQNQVDKEKRRFTGELINHHAERIYNLEQWLETLNVRYDDTNVRIDFVDDRMDNIKLNDERMTYVFRFANEWIERHRRDFVKTMTLAEQNERDIRMLSQRME